MSPTLKQGQHALLNTADHFAKSDQINRGDIIAFRHELMPGKLLIKRVIGLPGERIQLLKSDVLINGEVLSEHYIRHRTPESLPVTWSTGKEEYVVLGDNRKDSLDSRKLGIIPIAAVEGKVRFRLWPPRIFH